MKPITLSLILLIILLSFSCDEATGPVGGGTIIGQWSESNAVVSLRITTKTPQTAKNLLNSTGEISVTGDYNTKLNMLISIEDEDSGDYGLILTDATGFIGFKDTSYLATIFDGESSISVAANDDTEFEDELEGDATHTFDEVTLNVTNADLTSEDTNLNASMNGSITLEVVNIPADTPTMLNSNAEQYYDFGNTVTTFYEDSTFTSSEAEGEGDTGTWSIIGDTLKITLQQTIDVDGEETTVDTTWSFNYVNYGNQFILSQAYDLCEGLEYDPADEDEMGCKDIYNAIEFVTHLDSNSISNAEIIYQIFFDIIPVTQTAKINSSTPSLLTIRPNLDYLFELSKMRKLTK